MTTCLRTRGALLLGVGALLLSGRVQAGPPAKFDEAFEAKRADVKTELSRASLVFLGEVAHVGTSPGFWCGVLKGSQTVAFRVVEVWKGNAKKDDEVTVRYLTLGGDGDPASPFPKEPKLREDWFRKGNRLLVLGGDEHASERLGAIPATDANLAAAREVFRLVWASTFPDRVEHGGRSFVRLGVYSGERNELAALVVEALRESGERPETFFVPDKLDARDAGGEVVIPLWHEAAFDPGNANVKGNPGGRCRNAHVQPTTKKVRFTLWK